MRKTTRLVWLVAIICLLAMAYGSRSAASGTELLPIPVLGDAATKAVVTYKTAASGPSVDFAPCVEDSEWAIFEVPLNYDDPFGRTLSIHIARHRATGDQISNLVVKPGGPSASVEDRLADDIDTFTADSNEMTSVCEAEFGAEYLASITTENAARDTEFVRLALGGKPLNYLGYSYRTGIGSMWPRDFILR